MFTFFEATISKLRTKEVCNLLRGKERQKKWKRKETLKNFDFLIS